MPSSDEPGPNDIVSERESQFIPRSDDDEVLWDVQEITAERGKKYKVKWVGIDPATGKPWAQSWVAKHDCTNKLVAEWKAKKKLALEKKRGRGSTTSRASGSSKRASVVTSGKKTRPSTSEAPSSRLDSVEQYLSPPPKKPTPKRRRQSETPATTSSVQLSPISADEDGDVLLGPGSSAEVALQNKVPLSGNRALLDEDDDESPTAKGKSERGSDARPKGTVSSRASDLREESGLPHSKTKTKAVSRYKERVADADVLSAVSLDEELRPSKSKKKSTSKRKSSLEQNDDLSEKEVELAVSRVKIGPPRGVKRREALKESESSSKPKPSRTKPTKPRVDEPIEEPVPREKSERHPGNVASFFGSPLLSRRNTIENATLLSPSPHIPIPQVLPSARLRSPDLSPGARARLELFDRMMVDASQSDAAPSPADIPERVPDNTHFNYNDTHDTFDDPDTFDPPRPLSPPPSKSQSKRSKLGTPNGFVVPETQSSGNFQSQSQSPLKPPSSPQPPPARDQSPRRPIDLPTIAVIAASAVASSASPQELLPPPQRLPPYRNRPSAKQTFKPIPHISPNTFRSTINARSHVTDSEAPPSSIESFTSPKRVDKGKQREVEEDQLQSLSEVEGDDERRKRLTQMRTTDSELKRRGKELFDQAQLTREAEREKKKKAKRLKAVDDIVNRTISSPKRSPFSSIRGAEDTLDVRLEEVADLSGGVDSMTLDTPEHSEAKPLSKERWERLRIELRQEEEESTQEAMGKRPSPPVKESEVMDVQIPLPRSLENSPSKEQIEDVNHGEPSVDLQQASVIVQASQEQPHEDMDIEPLPASQPRLISQDLTNSPKRKLGEALSLLNVKSEEIQRLERELADERKNLQGLKVELAEMQQSSEPTGPVLAALEAERAQWTEERSKWENDLLEWQTERKEMSDQKASLSARVADLSDAVVRAEEVRVKLSELEAERDAWTKERDAMLKGIALRSEEFDVLTKIRGEYDQDRVKWETESVSWVEERARWETERATLQEKQEALLRSVDELTVKVESMTAARISAEKDRDFFREQYTQASGFVNSVREENMELEKRVKIAEGQAQEGVAAIKAFFEGRIKALQADVDRWRGLTGLLEEKDRRTNDEIRIRAAQAPEFRDLCDRLDAENRTLKVDLRKFERTQQRSVVQRKKLYCEIFALKKERASLRSTLSRLVKMADGSTQETSHSAPAPPSLEGFESMDPNDIMILSDDTMPQSSDNSFDEPALFPCMWRPQWRDQCQQIFDTKEVCLASTL
ncbi:hypothetical protein J3R82DRAFT_1674 [Butyriboletus roseoflavus]|nr:hypothetical protein J3R82DRAFT_1674 [Butyriboletus roseoflavus]